MRNGESKNRAQISIFVILAIVVVGIILIYFAFKSDVLSIGKDTVSPEVAPIYSFVDNCVKKTSEDAVYYIGQTGGYFVNPEASTDNNIAYYLYREENLIPSKERIEKELSDYMNQMLFFCADNFINFPDFQIKQGQIKSSAKIESGKVIFNIEYPLTISKDDASYNIKKFESKIDVRFNVVYEAAYEIMQEQMKHKEDICLNCIQELADSNNLYVDMYDYQEKVVVFIITDPLSKINEKDFEFNFANSY